MGTSTKPETLQGPGGQRCGSFCPDAASSGTAECLRPGRRVAECGRRARPMPRGPFRASGAAQSPLPLPPPPSPPLPPPPPRRSPPGQPSRLPTFHCAPPARELGGEGKPGSASPPDWPVDAPPLLCSWAPPPPGGRLLSTDSRVNSVPGKRSQYPLRTRPRCFSLPKPQGKQWLSRMCGKNPNRGTPR